MILIVARDIETVVREILDESGELAVDAWSLDVRASLNYAGLSSLASVDIMLWLEEEFDIFFPEDGPWRRDLESIDSIKAAVRRLQAEAVDLSAEGD